MVIIFKRELRANLKSLLMWSLVMAALTVIGFGEYGIVIGDGMNMDINAVVDMMPRFLRVLLGMGSLSVNTPEGWYVCMYIWCVVVACMHSVLLGANVISKEERDKTSEFLYTKPITRGSIITGKALAALVNTCAITLIYWAGTMAVFGPYIKGTALMGQIQPTVLGMFITSVVFLFIGLCLSAMFQEKGKAVQYSAIALAVTYFVSVAIEAVGSVDFLTFLTPMRYFEPVSVMYDGISPLFVILSAALVAVSAYFTYDLYKKRNLHS